jgi:hypothetical protein
MPSEPNRFQRQEDLVPRDRLADIQATVIGVGASRMALPAASSSTASCR